ncbi:MAG: serine protease [Ruminococcaceae bacterium]|nr:serine protease [Oscillospiraceae bacterium]
MKKTKIVLTAICMALISAVLVNLTSCSTIVHAQDLMEDIVANEVAPVSDLSDGSIALSDFALRLFNACESGNENVLISPLSVLCALAMTANGAQGETQKQMETVLGMEREELNSFVNSYISSLAQGEKYKLELANSIWFTDHERFTVNRDFLQLNADYYGADIYKAPFDSSTVRDINNWVRGTTNGMIKSVLDEIPVDAVMYLINAVAFEAEWSEIYEKAQVQKGVFTAANGEKQKAEFMHGMESTYIEDENAEGFIKYYYGGKYAFAAILPDEGVSVSDYVSTLSGEKLTKMLKNTRNCSIETAIPKFEAQYSVEMGNILSSMGMTDAFSEELADFSKLGTSLLERIHISRVLHKTAISVAEKGTKAGAVTVVEVCDGTSIYVLEQKKVFLDRPFVYMIVDCETMTPFFIGTMKNMK